jgi:hypothetical protein
MSNSNSNSNRSNSDNSNDGNNNGDWSESRSSDSTNKKRKKKKMSRSRKRKYALRNKAKRRKAVEGGPCPTRWKCGALLSYFYIFGKARYAYPYTVCKDLTALVSEAGSGILKKQRRTAMQALATKNGLGQPPPSSR